MSKMAINRGKSNNNAQFDPTGLDKSELQCPSGARQNALQDGVRNF